jgi:hypothetical protein
MFLKKSIGFCAFLLFFVTTSFSQKTANWFVQPIDSISLTRIDYSKNELQNTASIFPLLAKLYKIKNFSNEKAVFVHIGDSHIQADMETSVIRNQLQNYFGNAGRGLVFPYQVAKSNAPLDIISSSKSSWKGNRLAKTDTLISCGISGFGIQSESINPELKIELRAINEVKDTFDKVTLFLGGTVSEIIMEYNDQSENICYNTTPNFAEINLKSSTSSFQLTFPASDIIGFYGASLEKKNTGGILYHSIGANGAKYSDYNKTSLFWNQLKNLNADCYIISLGTNEAQDPNLTAESYILDVKKMVDKIKLLSPNACIILTTPPISYFKKLRPNPILCILTDALIDYCNQNNLIYWDLFSISNGLEGASKWKSSQLLRPDLVHYSKEGYALQGNLFVAAFAKLWNDFLSKN